MLLNEISSEPKFFKDINSIEDWLLNRHILKNYTIHPETFVIDVNNTVDLDSYKGSTLPVKFGVINGHFILSSASWLTSLEGCPEVVNGDFYCGRNPLLTSAIGGPKTVTGHVSYNDTPLKNIEGLPKTMKSVSLSDTDITNFANIHKHVKQINQDIILGFITIEHIKSNILGLMLIKNLKKVVFNLAANNIKGTRALTILNKHLQGDRSITDCQIELQDAGLSEYAKL
jgi:hypothetical protein